MNTVSLIWMASSCGALLFFFSGFLLSRRLALSTVTHDATFGGQRSEQQVAALQEQLRQAKAREGEAERALTRLKDYEADQHARLTNAQQKLDELLSSRRKTLSQFGTEEDTNARVDTLKQALDEALTMGKASDERAERLEGLLAKATTRAQDLEDRCAIMEDEVQHARGNSRKDSSRLTMPQWRQSGEREELVGMLEGSRQEVETLTTAMKNIRQQYEDAERRNDQLRLLIDQKEREVKEARPMDQEVARLRKQLDELDQERRSLRRQLEAAPGGTHYLHQDTELESLQHQVEMLQNQLEIMRTENESLQELASDTKEDSAGKDRSGRATMPMKAVDGDITDSMSAYTESAGALGLVLSDAAGLPVVHSGEHSEEIAAVAAHITKLSAATAKLLPMGALSRLSMEDAEARTVTIFPLASQQLLLALLSDGQPPNEGALTEMMVQAEAML